MKIRMPFIAAVVGSMIFTSCQTESVDQETTVAFTTQLNVSAKEQTPNAALDGTTQGLYHGVIASGATQSRGKIWLNLGNNTQNTATIEMQDGTTATFTGKNLSKNVNTYAFKGRKGSFTVVATSVNNPEVKDVVLEDASYLAYVIKDASTRRATSYTGTFAVTGGTLMGTWNILSNGTSNPNGQNGTAISDVMVTFNGTMYEDTTMELGDIVCFGSNVVPIVDIASSANDGAIAPEQESDFGGTTSWTLNRSIINGGYFTNQCGGATSGTFAWTNPADNTVRSGTISLD